MNCIECKQPITGDLLEFRGMFACEPCVREYYKQQYTISGIHYKKKDLIAEFDREIGFRKRNALSNLKLMERKRIAKERAKARKLLKKRENMTTVQLEMTDGTCISADLSHGNMTGTVIADTAIGKFTFKAASIRALIAALGALLGDETKSGG